MTITREIEYFVAIVREGNLSRAAEKLCISQPALSKYLAKLENDMGTQLVIRDSKDIILSSAGKIYYEAADKVMGILRSAEKKIEDSRDKGPRGLVIGATGAKSQYEISRYISSLLKQFPSLTLKIVEHHRDELIRLIRQREIDMGIFANSEVDPDLESVLLYRTEVQLAVDKRHPLAKEYGGRQGAKVDVHTLTGERFVLPSRVTMFRRNIDEYLEREGVTLDIAVETKSKDTAMLYVQNGIAIGFFPKHHYKKYEDLIYLDLEVPFYHQVSIFYARNEYLTEHAKEFIRLSVEHYKEDES